MCMYSKWVKYIQDHSCSHEKGLKGIWFLDDNGCEVKSRVQMVKIGDEL